MTEKSIKREMTGTISSDKMDKTVVVTVERLEKHPVFQKYIRRRSKYKAHDEKNEAKIGDTVRIEQTRPLSKEKCWRVVEILERAK